MLPQNAGEPGTFLWQTTINGLSNSCRDTIEFVCAAAARRVASGHARMRQLLGAAHGAGAQHLPHVVRAQGAGRTGFCAQDANEFPRALCASWPAGGAIALSDSRAG